MNANHQANTATAESINTEFSHKTSLGEFRILGDKPPETTPIVEEDDPTDELSVNPTPTPPLNPIPTPKPSTPKEVASADPYQEWGLPGDDEGDDRDDDDRELDSPKTVFRMRTILILVGILGSVLVLTRCNSRGGTNGTLLPFVTPSPSPIALGEGASFSPTPIATPMLPPDLVPREGTPVVPITPELQQRNQAVLTAMRYAYQNVQDLIDTRRNWYLSEWEEQNRERGIPLETYLIIEVGRLNRWHEDVFDRLRAKVMNQILKQQDQGNQPYDTQPIQLYGDSTNQSVARPMSIDTLAVTQLLIEVWIKNGTLKIADDPSGSIRIDDFNNRPEFAWVRRADNYDRRSVKTIKPAAMILALRVLANVAAQVRSLDPEERVSTDYAQSRLNNLPAPPAKPQTSNSR